MRLDHLLSKEPIFCVAGLFLDVFLGAGHVFGFWVEHWLLPCFVVARCWVLRGRWPFGGFGFSVEPRALPVFAGGFWGVCFENFIVDASIFVVFVVGFLASYLVRSVDALAPRADEGRCNLR